MPKGQDLDISHSRTELGLLRRTDTVHCLARGWRKTHRVAVWSNFLS